MLEQERIAITMDDAKLDAAVHKALSAVKGLAPGDVKINVVSGTLEMTGIVGHASLVIQAQDAVKRVAGLKGISNRLVSADQMGWD